MIIQHNMAALFANRQLGVNNKSKAQAAERLGSGYKINRAADNAAGLTISEEMRAQVRGLERAAQNVQEGINFCQVADGALNEVHSILGRLRELAVQASNDTNTSTDRGMINEEVKQLKKEINSISRNTEYNTYHIFGRSYELTFGGEPLVVGIFDANDGDPADPDSYGGIIVNGSTRVAWSEIDPDMTYLDSATGVTMFREGRYQYDTGSCILTIECEEGSKPPAIKAEIPVKASTAGISLAGTEISWADILDEENKPISATGPVRPGIYHFAYGGMEVSFTVPEGDTLEDVIDGITNGNQRLGRKYTNVYNGYYRAQAVDITDTGSRMRITNSMFPQIKDHEDLDFKLRADTTGIWVLDSGDNEVSGSKKSWADLGINRWDSQNDISGNRTYQYRYENDDYKVVFDFTLLRETSLDSVISGINHAAVRDTDITASNETKYTFVTAPGSGLVSGTLVSTNNRLTIYEEAALGRDFDSRTQGFGEAALIYDSAANQFAVSWNNTEGTPLLTYTSVSLSPSDSIRANANEYIQYLTARKIQSLLSGEDFSDKTLTQILGAGKITDAGYMDGTVTIDKGAMNTTRDISNGTYPTARIDFSGLGSDYELYDLLGTGFNSTCKTCNNHYSVMFVYGGTDKTTSQGYGYTLSNDGNENYSLQIDLKSVAEKGNATGADFAGALVDIMRESGYDFHFTQYASQGSTLYICDNRPQNTGTMDATFDTKPYEVDKATINMTLKNTADNRNMRLQFEYDISQSLETSAIVKMEEDPSGEWVQDADGYKKYVYSDYYDGSGGFKPGITEEPPRYNISITNTISSWEAYYDSIMNDIASGSKLELEATDYAYANYAANENPNSAVVSTFDFRIEEKLGFWIQAGANKDDGMAMTWEGFNAYSLGIGSSGTSTREAASDLILEAEKASGKISRLRSHFGAYANRMEHMYNIAQNTSENLQYAESRIRDTEMAEEMVRFSKSDILAQAAQAMLVQANQSVRGVTALLQ